MLPKSLRFFIQFHVFVLQQIYDYFCCPFITLCLMNHYLEARQWLRPGITFDKFAKRLPTNLKQSSLLSLLVGAVMQQGLEPFDRYLELLTKQGADVNYCQYPMKMNLLMLAAKKTKVHIVETLINQPKIQIYHRDQNGRNAAHYAIENQDQAQASQILSLLLHNFPGLVNVYRFKKSMGNYPKGNYLTQAIREGKPNLVSLLIQQEINSLDKSLEGLSPLHQTVRAHKSHRNKEVTLQILKTLLSAGCKQQEENSQGQNYVSYALDKGYLHQTEIDEILDIVNDSTPKATIETSPEQKMNQIFSNQSIENQIEERSSDEESQEEQIQPYKQNDQLIHYELSSEMHQWATEIHKEQSRVWSILYPFYLHIQKLAAQYCGMVELIGSFASQLWIPSSDIDIMVIIPDCTNPNLFDEITDLFYNRVVNLGMHNSIRLLRTYKLPMIKLVLNQNYEKLDVEIFITGKKNIASRYVSYSIEVMTYYPEVAIIYYVLRRLFALQNLHDHRKGGFKAYALFLLIFSMRRQYQYSYVSQFLQHFCYYYGFAFDYPSQLSQAGEIEYRININDPLNSENNMGGKRTDICSLQKIFKKIYYAINIQNEGSKLSYIVEILKNL